MSTSSNPIESSATRPASCRPMKAFEGKTEWINSVAYFPDGRRVAGGYRDRTVIIWDVESGMQDGMPLYHSAGVKLIAISPNGRRIASGLRDGGMVIWDAPTRKVVHEIVEANVGLLAYSPDGRWIATMTMFTSVIRLWDADTGRPGREPLNCSDMLVTSMAFSPDGSRIAVGSAARSFEVIDISTGECVVGPITGHTYWVTSILYSPDGGLLVTASGYDSIRVWDSKTGVQVGKPMLGHEEKVDYLSITADGRRIASCAGRDSRVWDLETRLQVGDSFQGFGPVAFSPDGRYLISGWGGNINLFDTESFGIQASSSQPSASNLPAPLRQQRQARAKSSSINSSLLDLPAVVQQQPATQRPQERTSGIGDDWDTESMRLRLRPTEPQQDPPLERETSTVQPATSDHKWLRNIRERWRHIRHRRSRVPADLSDDPHLPLPLHKRANARASSELPTNQQARLERDAVAQKNAQASHSRTQPSTNQDEANVAFGKLDERLYAAPPRDRYERRRWRARERRRAARNASLSPDSESDDDDAESYYEDTGCLDAVCFGEYFRRRRHLQRRYEDQ